MGVNPEIGALEAGNTSDGVNPVEQLCSSAQIHPHWRAIHSATPDSPGADVSDKLKTSEQSSRRRLQAPCSRSQAINFTLRLSVA